jgi:FKBP-type peptidyl-prolyl cis-trans isomerase FkpA
MIDRRRCLTAALLLLAPALPVRAQPAGLQVIDRQVGTGPTAEHGLTVVVDYTGWLYDAAAPQNKGKMFDSSHGRGQPISFVLGVGRVIAGWDQGLLGMKVGGERTLIIPPDLAYGAKGFGTVIPPNAALVFDVRLVGVR